MVWSIIYTEVNNKSIIQNCYLIIENADNAQFIFSVHFHQNILFIISYLWNYEKYFLCDFIREDCDYCKKK